MTMTPIIIWTAIVALLLVIITADIIVRHRHSRHEHSRRIRPIDLATEREEFFITGDRLAAQEDDDDDF